MRGYETERSRVDSGPAFSGGAGAVAPLMRLWIGWVLLGMLLLKLGLSCTGDGVEVPCKLGKEQVQVGLGVDVAQAPENPKLIPRNCSRSLSDIVHDCSSVNVRYRKSIRTLDAGRRHHHIAI